MSEAPELGDEPSGQPFGVRVTGEVVATKVLVGNLVLENVVGGDQDRMGHGGDCSHVAAAAFDAEVEVPGPDRRVGTGTLDERGSQARIAVSPPARLALAT